MRRRLSLLLMLAAWLLATGSHWDVVQTFAWGRMMATYAKSMPLGEAVRLTFTQDSMCRVCVAVADAKEETDQTAAPGGKAEDKILLGLEPVPVVVVAAPAETGRPPWSALNLSGGRAAPPAPPPRLG